VPNFAFVLSADTRRLNTHDCAEIKHEFHMPPMKMQEARRATMSIQQIALRSGRDWPDGGFLTT
jgi:hypothetical protein